MGSTAFALTPFTDYGAAGIADYCYPHLSGSDADSYYSRPIVDYSTSSTQLKLADERVKCDKNLGWSIDWATAFLVDYLTTNASEIRSSLRRIAARAEQFVDEGEWEALPFFAFNSINNTLFAKRLKDAVYLSYEHLGTEVSGATYTHGQGPNRRVRRLSIVLNSTVLHDVSGPHLLATLVHHMVHAYFLVACGPEREKETTYGRLDHGVAFTKILNTIKELAKCNGKSLLPGFGSSRRIYRRHTEDDYYYYWHPRSVEQHYSKDWYCSHCELKQDGASDGDVDKWFNSVSKPLHDLPDYVRKSMVHIYNNRDELEEVPRSETTPSGKSVQFIFEKRAILVPASKIDKFTSIRRAFDKAGTVYMEVPDDVTHDGFMALLELLHKGTYSPDSELMTGGGRSGPPVIKPTRASSPSYLLRDIDVFKTGQAMGFSDLLSFAIKRMYAQTLTHEDPIRVLQAIYEGKESPHCDIRSWAQRFLLKSETHDGMHGFHSLARPDVEPPNLVKLLTEMNWKEHFLSLCERSASLQVDVGNAMDTLTKEGRWQLPSTRQPVIGGPALSYAGLPMGGLPIVGGALPAVAALPAAVPPANVVQVGLGVGVTHLPLMRGLSLPRTPGYGRWDDVDDWYGDAYGYRHYGHNY